MNEVSELRTFYPKDQIILGEKVSEKTSGRVGNGPVKRTETRQG